MFRTVSNTLELEAGWTRELEWTSLRRQNILSLQGIEPRTLDPVSIPTELARFRGTKTVMKLII
jgi:hypothetical protein